MNFPVLDQRNPHPSEHPEAAPSEHDGFGRAFVLGQPLRRRPRRSPLVQGHHLAQEAQFNHVITDGLADLDQFAGQLWGSRIEHRVPFARG